MKIMLSKSFIQGLMPLILVLNCISNNSLIAQPTVKAEISDPKTKVLLDKVKKQYESYSSLETTFKLEIKMAEQPKPDVQAGKLTQQGDRYRVDMNKDFIIGDSKIIWQKAGNIVRIMSANGKSTNELLSPKDLIKIYEKKEYIFGTTGERAEGWSTKATIVTLKPVNKRSDYTKIDIAIDQKTNYIVGFGGEVFTHKKCNPVSKRARAGEVE